MKQFYKLTLGVMIGSCLTSLSAQAQDYLPEATLDYPDGFYVSMAPGNVDITWNNEAFELVDPQKDEYGDECVKVQVKLGEEEAVEANGYCMYLEGFDDVEDIWLFEIGLYDIENIFDFDGDTIVITIPEGVVKTPAGAINPEQELTFYLVDTYNKYSETPATGSEIEQKDAIVRISFGENPIEYLNGHVVAYIYDPEYAEFHLDYEKEVTINEDNELVIDLTSLSPGEYELLIPEGFVNVKEDDATLINPAIWFEYTITETVGISSITTIQGNNRVYNLNGMKVTTNGKPASGIYVINGKKVVIK